MLRRTIRNYNCPSEYREYFCAFYGKVFGFVGEMKLNVFFPVRFVIPESPRWLLCKGRVAEVKAIIKTACEFNGHAVPENIDKVLRPPSQQDEEDADEGCIKLFGSKYLRLITFCFVCVWFSMNMVYYGIILNMNEFGGNVYLNSVSAGFFLPVLPIFFSQYFIMITITDIFLKYRISYNL